MKLGQTRSELYRGARLIGDAQAVAGGPAKVAKRLVRKKLGRTYGSWLRRLLR